MSPASTTPENLTSEDYTKAMNSIGQNLFSSLVQSMSELPPHFRNQKMAINSLAAFCINVIHKQASGNPEVSQQLVDELIKLMHMHIDSIREFEASKIVLGQPRP